MEYKVTKPIYSCTDYDRLFKHNDFWTVQIVLHFQSENLIIATASARCSRFDIVLCRYYESNYGNSFCGSSFCFTITNWCNGRGLGGALSKTTTYSNYNDEQLRRGGMDNDIDILSATFALGKLMEIMGVDK